MSESSPIPAPTPEEETAETIAAVAEVMSLFRAEMETIDKVAWKIANKTTRIVKTVVILLSFVSIYLLFLINDMAKEMSQMTLHLESMYTQFGRMSDDMEQITGLVLRMETNVRGIRDIAGHMSILNADMISLTRSVDVMNQDVVTLNGNIGLISRGTGEMSQRFNSLSHTVDYMRHNVGEMARPTRILP